MEIFPSALEKQILELHQLSIHLKMFADIYQMQHPGCTVGAPTIRD